MQYVTIIFKPLGESKGHDDQFLTLASSFGLILNVVARFSGGIILEKVKFKLYFGLVLFASAFCSFTFMQVAANELLFIIYLGAAFFISGSVFVAMPVFYGKIFGPEVGSQAYALFFTSNSFATMTFSFIVRTY